MSEGLISIAKVKNMITLPTYIFDDKRVSLGAKGIFVQICYSKEGILTLSDIAEYANTSEKEIKNYINELIDLGYIEKSKNGSSFSLRHKPYSPKMVKEKIDTEDIKESISKTKITPVIKKNIFDTIREKVNILDLQPSTKKLLTTYFIKWLNGEDRFEAQPLYKNMLDGRIKNLMDIKEEYSLNQSDLEKCITQSIENHWFKFIWPLTNKNFNKNTLVSGDYSQEEREEVMRKAQARLEKYNDEY